jgi:hypothetical protein
MNWRTKLAIAAWRMVAIISGLLVRNLMLGGWKDLPLVSRLLMPLFLIFFSASYLCCEVRGKIQSSRLPLSQIA